MKIKQCNRNPYFLSDFAYDGEFSDGGKFELRIPEKDVEEFANKLLKAYEDDMNGEVKVVPPHVHITSKGAIFHDGSVIKNEQYEKDKVNTTKYNNPNTEID